MHCFCIGLHIDDYYCIMQHEPIKRKKKPLKDCCKSDLVPDVLQLLLQLLNVPAHIPGPIVHDAWLLGLGGCYTLRGGKG